MKYDLFYFHTFCLIKNVKGTWVCINSYSHFIFLLTLFVVDFEFVKSKQRFMSNLEVKIMEQKINKFLIFDILTT